MKSILFLFFIFVFSTLLKSQSVTIVEKNMLSKTNPDIDTLIGIRAKLIQFKFDTLFFINQKLIDDYSGARQNVKFLTEQIHSLIDTTRFTLKDIQVNFLELNNTIDANTQSIKQAIQENNSRVILLENNNSKLIETNKQLKIDLENASDKLKAEKWNSLWKKYAFGAGGIVIGAGLGALIVAAAN